MLAGEYFHTKCTYQAAVKRSVYSFWINVCFWETAINIDKSPWVCGWQQHTKLLHPREQRMTCVLRSQALFRKLLKIAMSDEQQQCACSIIANHLGLWCRIWQTSAIYSSKLSHVSVHECPKLHQQILKWTQKPGSLTPSHCFPSSEEFWSEHFTFEHSAFLCDLYVTSGKAKPGFTVKA